MVFKTLMDQGLTEPKYLGLVASQYKKLKGISKDISGLRRVSEGRAPSFLLQNRRTCAIRITKTQRDSVGYQIFRHFSPLIHTDKHHLQNGLLSNADDSHSGWFYATLYRSYTKLCTDLYTGHLL